MSALNPVDDAITKRSPGFIVTTTSSPAVKSKSTEARERIASYAKLCFQSFFAIRVRTPSSEIDVILSRVPSSSKTPISHGEKLSVINSIVLHPSLFVYLVPNMFTVTVPAVGAQDKTAPKTGRLTLDAHKSGSLQIGQPCAAGFPF